jgi:hypothetical protein
MCFVLEGGQRGAGTEYHPPPPTISPFPCVYYAANAAYPLVTYSK